MERLRCLELGRGFWRVQWWREWGHGRSGWGLSRPGVRLWRVFVGCSLIVCLELLWSGVGGWGMIWLILLRLCLRLGWRYSYIGIGVFGAGDFIEGRSDDSNFKPQIRERTPEAEARFIGRPMRPKAEALGYLEARATALPLSVVAFAF